MWDAERRVARFFQSFGRTRALLIKAEEIFTVPQTKPRVLILEGGRRASETAMLYFVFIKGGDWQLGGNFPALNQGSYWRGQSREHRDLAKQSNTLASCYWQKAWPLLLFSLSYHLLLSNLSITEGKSAAVCTCSTTSMPKPPLLSKTNSIIHFICFFELVISTSFLVWCLITI